ncbi:hypothetical protein AVEN_54440-1 [Araneus ventricosus]|uniref:Uncharacterized protein n=1 Tax=Araneus ventricosus TaxID=182803 RepID=A0A4Y2D9J0_ARAVE|nr:hypothetical protein AVEN_54440-1 [Araneus ventricosus]
MTDIQYVVPLHLLAEKKSDYVMPGAIERALELHNFIIFTHCSAQESETRGTLSDFCTTDSGGPEWSMNAPLSSVTKIQLSPYSTRRDSDLAFLFVNSYRKASKTG